MVEYNVVEWPFDQLSAVHHINHETGSAIGIPHVQCLQKLNANPISFEQWLGSRAESARWDEARIDISEI